MCRIALGICEAVIGPALIMITSMYYTKAEATPRYGFWYCGLGVGQIIGGLISFAAQHAPPTLSFAGWRIMFVSVGVANILVSILCLTFLPSTMESAPFLLPAERTFISHRLAADRAGTGPKIFSWRGALAAFSDLQSWLLALLTLLTTTPSGVITTYSSILIKNFGYTAREAALLNTPSGLVSIAATLLTTYSIVRGWQRTAVIALILLPTLLGAALMSFLPSSNQAGLLAGIYLVNCTVAPLALTYAFPRLIHTPFQEREEIGGGERIFETDTRQLRPRRRQLRRLHQEDRRLGHGPRVLQPRQHPGAADVPGARRASVHPRQGRRAGGRGRRRGRRPAAARAVRAEERGRREERRAERVSGGEEGVGAGVGGRERGHGWGVSVCFVGDTDRLA